MIFAGGVNSFGPSSWAVTIFDAACLESWHRPSLLFMHMLGKMQGLVSWIVWLNNYPEPRYGYTCHIPTKKKMSMISYLLGGIGKDTVVLQELGSIGPLAQLGEDVDQV